MSIFQKLFSHLRDVDFLVKVSENSLTRWLKAMEPYGIVLALIALAANYLQMRSDLMVRQEERVERQLEREHRDLERIHNAWQLLTTKASGNSGKKEALEYLHSNGQTLVGIDISCQTMGNGWNRNTGECDSPTFLKDLDLSTNANRKPAVLLGANFSHAELEASDFTNAVLEKSVFIGTRLKESKFAKANLETQTCLTLRSLNRI